MIVLSEHDSIFAASGLPAAERRRIYFQSICVIVIDICRAVTYENGEIFRHFGHTGQFKLYDVEEGKIVNEQVIDTNGSGHGALAGFLQAVKTDVLICGDIGMGAKTALADAGIRLYAGVQGPADAATKALAEGTLEYDPDAKCDNHDHHHGE